jgi:enoyl-CoA hydratase/carnithine racemase
MADSYRYANKSTAIELDSPGVFILWLNRPSYFNAMSNNFWPDLTMSIDYLLANEDVRALVLAAKGKHFSVGLDRKILWSTS